MENSLLFNQLDKNASYIKLHHSETFPKQHHRNHVATGLLHGPDLHEIDPILFVNEDEGQFVGFYHLGRKLTGNDGNIHSGIFATILDEGLCACGFSKLPSKRGVTASLKINFNKPVPPDTTVVLQAKVTESRGRKAIIDGDLRIMNPDGTVAEDVVASSTCILVEPKWFKYLRWLPL